MNIYDIYVCSVACGIMSSHYNVYQSILYIFFLSPSLPSFLPQMYESNGDLRLDLLLAVIKTMQCFFSLDVSVSVQI